MRRRIVLAGLAAALGSARARAQSTPSPAAGSGPAAGLPPAPAMKVDLPLRGLSDAARTHLRDTAAAGALLLALSRIAAKKLKHPMTRQFADFEIAEQETLADVLRDRMMPGSRPSGQVTPPTDAAVQDALDPGDRDAVDAFRALREGPDFEKSYVRAEVEGHRRLLDVQDAYLKVADDAEATMVAKLARGLIREHLALLGDIGKHLG